MLRGQNIFPEFGKKTSGKIFTAMTDGTDITTRIVKAAETR
jgi:hypothetical protein